MPRAGLRIIGGEWRGRRLAVPGGLATRPTTDRVRETLFNWLAPLVEGARCLDLFAGSGALGIEALSRGAATTDFVDLDRQRIEAIRQMLATLDALERARLHAGSARQYLDSVESRRCWDIVFIDPPFRAGLAADSLTTVAPRLSAENRVYLEHERENGLALPDGWQELRSGTAGQLTYRLLHYQGTA